MTNGHVKIHDVFENHTGLNETINCDPEAASDSSDMEDTPEFRLLMAYAQRRRPKRESAPQQGPSLGTGGTDVSPQTETQERKRKKKKKGWKRLTNIFSCMSAQRGEIASDAYVAGPDELFRGLPLAAAAVEEEEEEEEEEGDLKDAACRLTDIADEIQFVPPDIEMDSPEDVNVEKMIGLLLRESGDRLNESELKDSGIAMELFWDYNFFRLLMTTLLMRMGLRSPDPDSLGPKASPKTQIAVTCEITSRLSAVNTLPRNQLLGHGARYLQTYYSSWAQQQGGYEEAFYSDDEDDIQ